MTNIWGFSAFGAQVEQKITKGIILLICETTYRSLYRTEYKERIVYNSKCHAHSVFFFVQIAVQVVILQHAQEKNKILKHNIETKRLSRIKAIVDQC